MSVPLATLPRRSGTVWLYDRFGDPFGDAAAPEGTPATRAVALGQAAAFEAYLRFWQNDAAALMDLRYALHRVDPGGAIAHFTHDRVLHLLAGLLARGALVLREAVPPEAPAGLPVPPAVEAPEEAPVPLANMPEEPVPAPVVPLLPVLEELQIEGAEVLPEVMQTLEQIDLTMGSIDMAGVSLEPTPSKVPPIGTAVDEASAAITATLDAL